MAVREFPIKVQRVGVRLLFFSPPWHYFLAATPALSLPQAFPPHLRTSKRYEILPFRRHCFHCRYDRHWCFSCSRPEGFEQVLYRS